MEMIIDVHARERRINLLPRNLGKAPANFAKRNALVPLVSARFVDGLANAIFDVDWRTLAALLELSPALRVNMFFGKSFRRCLLCSRLEHGPQIRERIHHAACF